MAGLESALGRLELGACSARPWGGGVSTLAEDTMSWGRVPLTVRELGRFSTGPDGEYLEDESQLRHLLLLAPDERILWDLTIGYDDWKPTEKSRQNYVCEWLSRHPGTLPDVHFVCRRSCITTIAHTPYSNKPWTIAIVRFRKTLFMMRRNQCGEDGEKLWMKDERSRRMSYWAHNFKTFLSADANNHLDTDGVFNNVGGKFHRVVENELGSHKLLIMGLVDCFDDDRQMFVQHELCKKPVNYWQEGNMHRYKTLKWWLQSSLVGIKRIVVVDREEDGFVRSIREWRLEELVWEARKSRCAWEPQACLNFADAVLSLVASTITRDDPHQVWLLEWEVGDERVEAPRPLSREESEAYAFLSNDFLDSFQHQSNSPVDPVQISIYSGSLTEHLLEWP